MRRFVLMLTLLSLAVLLLAAPAWEKKDFSQWTTEDAKKILSDSPWAKTIHLNIGSMAAPAGATGAKQYLVAPTANGEGPQRGASGGGQMGGAGQQQSQQPMPGSASQNEMGRPGQTPGQNPQAGSEPAMQQGVPVVVEWESAVPVRLAELKLKSGDSQPSQADVEQAKKPSENYIIALVGVPGQPKEGEEKDMATSATITPKNKQSIQATSVKEQAISGGTRAIIFTFPKAQPITEDDKTVQFRLVKGPLPTDVKENFKLKDMRYDGKLAL